MKTGDLEAVAKDAISQTAHGLAASAGRLRMSARVPQGLAETVVEPTWELTMESLRFTRTGFALCIALATNAAFANCKPLIDAYEKSGKQKRTAMYGDAPTAPLTTPMHKWINEDNMMGGTSVSLRSGEKKGEIRCTAQGSGDYRGAKANKYEVESSVGKSVTKEVVWIDVASGMPVLVQNPKYGTSMAFQYGDAVK